MYQEPFKKTFCRFEKIIHFQSSVIMENFIRIRNAGPEDMEGIFAFICELEEVSYDFDLFKRFYLCNISNKDNIYLVAADGLDKPVGFISCHGQVLLHHMGKAYEIQEMFVDRNHRNKGIGKLMVRELEKFLQKEDYVLLEVSTNAKRQDSQEFYRKCGFEQTHLKFSKWDI
jgi:(aminoalkyl)phosphonate N-acetyltransferase